MLSLSSSVKLGVRVNINYGLFVLSYLGTILNVCRNWCFCNSKWRKGTTNIQYSLRLDCAVFLPYPHILDYRCKLQEKIHHYKP